MKRIWLILSMVGIVALVAMVILWPRGYVQGRLEVWQGFGGVNSEGVLELNTQKWLVTDDTDYYLEFLPSCQLVGIKEGESVNSISIGNKWYLIESGATYCVKGNVSNGAPTVPLDQWALKADDKGNFSNVAPSVLGKRQPHTIQVYYIKFVRPADGANK